jgi:N-acetylglucosamine kinase-like BadF-type ATPase
MPHLLAIDSGGTKCDALLVHPDGLIAGRGICCRPGLSGRSETALVEAVTQALDGARLRRPRLHVASFGCALPAALLNQRRITILSAHVTTEYDAALRLANQTHGIVALAGTGAFVHARLPDGRQLHLDGLGPLLGDYGAGFFIGREALRAVARSEWNPRHHTSLRASVLAACGAKKIADLIPLNWTVQDRSEIARLAPLVDAAARQGDRIAGRILQTAAESLAETLRDVVENLRLARRSLPLIGAGSVMTRSDLYWKHFRAAVRAFAPALKPCRLQFPLVAGVALSCPALQSPHKFRRYLMQCTRLRK